MLDWLGAAEQLLADDQALLTAAEREEIAEAAAHNTRFLAGRVPHVYHEQTGKHLVFAGEVL
jgi:hypothetical protein